MDIYLGFDASTQSLTATAIAVDGRRREILFTRAFRYDDQLPQYGTRHGVLPSPDPAVVHAPPLMWADAMDEMFARLLRDPGAADWRQLRAIAGSAQQHGSVYLNASAAGRLAHIDHSRPLAHQLQDGFSRRTSPVWMDSSTSRQCAAIEAALGGPAAVARLTGSRAFERFTGPQIRKFAEEEPVAYENTDRIHLVSSFLASVLAGRHAALDHADGSGMNLMDLAARQWSARALEATAPDLASKLPPIVASSSIVGTLAPFWQRRYALPPARVVAWSGDNPCSLVGTGVIREGIVAVSLGTSDTVFGIMREPRVSADGTGHAFASPTGEFMGMTVFRNGSLARERVRDAYGLDWNGFSAALRRTPAGNGGRIMLPWFEPEITPHVATGGARLLDLNAGDAAANVRAVIEGQMMAMARHSRWMQVRMERIHATGGASGNPDILQVMADVFDADILLPVAGNSAALGAALRAFHADRAADGNALAWEDVVAELAEPIPETRVRPIREHVAVYRRLIEDNERFEREAMR